MKISKIIAEMSQMRSNFLIVPPLSISCSLVIGRKNMYSDLPRSWRRAGERDQREGRRRRSEGSAWSSAWSGSVRCRYRTLEKPVYMHWVKGTNDTNLASNYVKHKLSTVVVRRNDKILCTHISSLFFLDVNGG